MLTVTYKKGDFRRLTPMGDCAAGTKMRAYHLFQASEGMPVRCKQLLAVQSTKWFRPILSSSPQYDLRHGMFLVLVTEATAVTTGSSGSNTRTHIIEYPRKVAILIVDRAWKE